MRPLRDACAWLRHAATAVALTAAAQSSAPQFQPRAVLAEAAARELDPRPGLRHRGRPERPHLDRAPARPRCSTTKRARRRTRRETKCCKAAPAVLKFDADGNLLASWGAGVRHTGSKNEHGIHVDARRQRLGRRQQRRRPDSEVLARRQIHRSRSARTTAPRARCSHDPARPPGAHGDRRRGGRDLRRRRLRQPPHRRVRRQDRRLQAPLGRLRHQDAARRQAAGLHARRRRPRRAVRQPGALRAAVQRRPRLCLRPRQRPHPGVPQGRQLREGVPRSRRRRCRTARCGTWCCPRTRSSASSSSPTAPTARSSRIDRENGAPLTQWGRHGRQPGQFKWVHNIAIDSKGNLYTAEVGFGRRAQKFRRVE